MKHALAAMASAPAEGDKMKLERTTEELLKHEAAAKARNAIRRMQQQIVSKLLAMTQAVEGLLEHLTEKEVLHFLHAACEMDLQDGRAYVKASQKLKDSHDLLKKARAGFPLLKALATTDPQTREEALCRIRDGATLGARDVSAIRAYHRSQKLSWAEIQTKEATASARREARRHVAQGVADVGKQVGEIMCSLNRLRVGEVDAAVRPDAIAELRKASSAVLPLFEKVYGQPKVAVEDMRKAGSRFVDVAYPALIKIAEGKFGSEHGFHLGDSRQNSIGLVRCLQRVTTAMPPAPAHMCMPDWPAPAPTVVELCAGAGGMALGLERAGYEAVALFEYEKNAAATLRRNRPSWPVFEGDIREVDFKPYRDRQIDLLVGGLPCQPYSVEGNGLGKDDPRDLLPEGVRAVDEMRPAAFLFENVTGLLHARHADHLGWFMKSLRKSGYSIQIVRMEAEDYGIPQERSRIMIAGMRKDKLAAFRMPPRFPELRTNIGDTLVDLMGANGWSGAEAWAEALRNKVVVKNGVEYRGVIASTVVGRKGGSREKEMNRWGSKGIDIRNVADHAPTQAQADAAGEAFLPALTLRMRARLQAFPDNWEFVGGKDSAAKQIGNAVPPPVAMAIGLSVRAALQDMQFDHGSSLRTGEAHQLEGRPLVKIGEVPPLAPSLAENDVVKPQAIAL